LCRCRSCRTYEGAYNELDKYFINDKNPGLKKNFSKELIDYIKIDGKLYTIQLYVQLGTVDGVYIRKELREKYCMQPIQNYDDPQKYWNKVLESEKGMIPYGTDGS
jgi:putative aldouronate transport system substrate-binding protein